MGIRKVHLAYFRQNYYNSDMLYCNLGHKTINICYNLLP